MAHGLWSLITEDAPATARESGTMRIQVPESITRIVDDEGRRLSLTFFVFFSRFEYALKRAGYLQHDNSDARPDWTEFAKMWNDHFDSCETPELQAAVAYFEANPPKKQIVDGGRLEWSSVRPGSQLELERMLILVRRVRNNLFHGGKLQGAASDPSRDRMLLSQSLAILQACVELDPDVARYIKESLTD